MCPLRLWVSEGYRPERPQKLGVRGAAHLGGRRQCARAQCARAHGRRLSTARAGLSGVRVTPRARAEEVAASVEEPVGGGWRRWALKVGCGCEGGGGPWGARSRRRPPRERNGRGAGGTGVAWGLCAAQGGARGAWEPRLQDRASGRAGRVSGGGQAPGAGGRSVVGKVLATAQRPTAGSLHSEQVREGTGPHRGQHVGPEGHEEPLGLRGKLCILVRECEPRRHTGTCHRTEVTPQ